MGSDLTHALRQFSKSPGFAAVAIVTLGVAIGINSAIFALIDAVLLRPAISLEPDRVVFFQVDAMDAVALGVSAAILSAATLVACGIPARRATKVSPLAAMLGR